MNEAMSAVFGLREDGGWEVDALLEGFVVVVLVDGRGEEDAGGRGAV